METFKDIKGFEGLYQVSDLGRIKSLARLDTIGRKVKEKILNPSKTNSGYLSLLLYNGSSSVNTTVHQLVAVTFLNHVIDGHSLVVNHIDFDKNNNNVNNLDIKTQRENANRKHLKSSSKYIGVSWVKEKNKWRSVIRINSKAVHLGYFMDELEASKTYQLALTRLNEYKGNSKEFRNYLLSLREQSLWLG